MRYLLALVVVVATGSSAWARDGANHHLGDDSFVARFGRLPDAGDGEPLRMRVHLEYVRALLGARPASAPHLAPRRAELLGYLDEYIAKGITPRNTYVPRRSPVFIDAAGDICAVGYLIARSVGRALPERIAATHRLDYLEDIAAAMPEVAGWIASSGLTLEELASIQPGYEGPEVQHAEGWLFAKQGEPAGWWGVEIDGKDGPYVDERGGIRLEGAFARQEMVGTWTRTLEGKVLGTGRFVRGAGRWTSFRPDGTRMAEGRYVKSRAQGTWRFFHPSGRIAAIGAMHRGKRQGPWTFFYDRPGHAVVSRGSFGDGEVLDGWRHFDASGRLVATAGGRAWQQLSLDVEPGRDGVRHVVVRGEPAASDRLDAFTLRGQRLYIKDRATMYDARGNELVKAETGWSMQRCGWASSAQRRAARRGDSVRLYDALKRRQYGKEVGEPTCGGDLVPVPAARARMYDAILASRTKLRTPIPVFAFAEPRGNPPEEPSEEADPDELPGDHPQDMATYLADYMEWYSEWPHVDRTFAVVFHSLPGYRVLDDDI